LLGEAPMWALGMPMSTISYLPFPLLKSLLCLDSLQKLWGTIFWLRNTLFRVPSDSFT
jgi:hypothetical protein